MGLCVAGVSLLVVALLPETFAPVLLARRAKALRQTGHQDVWGPLEFSAKGIKQTITVVLMRPLKMLACEAIVFFSCCFLTLVYAIFYLYFEAYPLIFEGVYAMSPGIAGLAFLPILVGACLALAIFISYDRILLRAQQSRKQWAQIEEFRRLPLACLGGPLFVIAIFWLGWSARSGVPWIVPMLAGVPFGIGFMLIFMALLNYLTDAYEIYAASAMAASSCTRSIFGAALPLAARPMYKHLGIAWGNSLLGLFSLAMCAIPFVFIKYGSQIRAGSRFSNELKAREAPQGPEASVVRRADK